MTRRPPKPPSAIEMTLHDLRETPAATDQTPPCADITIVTVWPELPPAKTAVTVRPPRGIQ